MQLAPAMPHRDAVAARADRADEVVDEPAAAEHLPVRQDVLRDARFNLRERRGVAEHGRLVMLDYAEKVLKDALAGAACWAPGVLRQLCRYPTH